MSDGNSNPAASTTWHVLVPYVDRYTTIDRGSGVVTGDLDSQVVTVDFEGNRFGAGNLQRYADRCRHAKGRQSTWYPTVARLSLPQDRFREMFRIVGTFDDLLGRVIIDPASAGEVARWCGVASMTDNELTMSDAQFAAVRELRDLASRDVNAAKRISRMSQVYREAGRKLGLTT
jgi:hypothetical protein